MQRVCVIGAGTMGSGIAAHLSNLGFEVILLDLTADSVQKAIDRAKQVRPPHFYDTASLQRVQVFDLQTGLDQIGDVDWVCEAIVEKLDLKKSLYERLIPVLPDSAMVSTNTSGLELRLLTEGFPESFRKRFLGTHFFNPPRYLKLLELIPTEFTSPEEIAKARQFFEEKVGRRVVVAKDTPGFIANRFGMWAMIHAIHTTEALGLQIETVDAITGPFLGRPRSASFRLNDLVGLDIMQDIAQNLSERCTEDPHRKSLETPKSMAYLLEKGWIGQKTRQGYYRKEGKELLAFDLNTHAYRNLADVSLPTIDRLGKQPFGQRVREALEAKDEAGEFLRNHLIPVLQYADYLKEEISHSVEDFDRVMMWGFGWEMGPFAMIDAIGHDVIGVSAAPYYKDGLQLGFQGEYVPRAQEPQFRTIHDFEVVSKYPGWTLRKLDEGVFAMSLSDKMGKVTPEMVRSMSTWLEENPESKVVLCGETRSFSVGYDLQFFADASSREAWDEVDTGLKELQGLSQLFSERHAVAVLHGYALGGGFELALGCPMILAHPEAQIGLPESKVGLIPGGAGTVRMRLNNQGSAKSVAHAAMNVSRGLVSSCAAEAKSLGFLRSSDMIALHPDRLIHDAIQLLKAGLPKREIHWVAVEGPLVGMIDRAQQESKAEGDMSNHDEFLGDRVKFVMAKSASLEEALLHEREQFIIALKNTLSQARIRHMLETGKPLRN